jgi:hypothetical protein
MKIKLNNYYVSDGKAYINKKTLTSIYGISLSKLRYLLIGEIPSVNVGKEIFYKSKEVISFLNEKLKKDYEL